MEKTEEKNIWFILNKNGDSIKKHKLEEAAKLMEEKNEARSDEEKKFLFRNLMCSMIL